MRKWITRGALALALGLWGCAHEEAEDIELTEDPAETAAAAADTADEIEPALPVDPDHEFLRMMSDHHEGLVRIAESSLEDGEFRVAAEDARALQDEQAAERDRLLAMIQAGYDERYRPRPMAKHEAHADSLSELKGRELDEAFYGMVIVHHRDGVAMIDRFMPRLADPELRRMAAEMRAGQQREIDRLERKLEGL